MRWGDDPVGWWVHANAVPIVNVRGQRSKMSKSPPSMTSDTCERSKVENVQFTGGL